MPSTANNRSLADWMNRIRTRQTVLPRFQRYEAWSRQQVTKLLNTILQDLPCGALLVLEIGDKEPFISKPVDSAPSTGERITEHLLDGQQRITAIWKCLKNTYPTRTYFLYLPQDEEDEETGLPYYIDSIPRHLRRRDGRKMPLWADNPKAQWERRAIPLHLCAPGDEAQQAYDNWSEEAIEDTEQRFANYKIISKVRQQFATFNIPYLSLPVTTKKETALEVFMDMNTSATPLSAYDIVVAQVEAGMGESLHDLVADTKESCPDIERYYEPEELVLAAGALLQGRVPSRINYLSDGFGKHLIENWDKYLKGIERTATFLQQEERIFDAARLPTDVVVPVLVALWAEAPVGLDAEGNARSIIRKYIWRAFFTSRYERSTATRSYADYDEIKNYLADPTDPAPSIFNEELPQVSELIDTGWPKKKDRLARAVLALSLKEGGLDLADGSRANPGNLSQREYHHLFPVGHLKRENPDISDDKVFNALNCALVTWRTNRAISDKEPMRYLTDRLQDSDPEGTEIKRRLESHLIPYDDMVSGNYDAFLQKRAELVLRSLKKLCD